MNFFIYGIFLLFFISSFISIQAYGEEAKCDWILEEKNLQVGKISIKDSEKVFTDINSQPDTPIEIVCDFDQPISLKDKMIGFDYDFKAPTSYDFTLSLIDNNGNTIFTSKPIKKLYDIDLQKHANLVLDPKDFKKISKTGTGFDLEIIKNVKLELNQTHFDSITISNLNIVPIGEFPDFSLDENLPIQSTIPAFFGLILISFPLGFVLLNNANFLKEENFFVKIPWFLGFGFCVYLVFIYLTSFVWISTEVVVGYVIVSLGILLLYLKKYKKSFFNFNSFKSKNTIIFFSIILIIAGTLSVNYIDSIGWPTGIWDSKKHVSFISLTMANNVIDDGKSFLPISDIPGWSFSNIPLYPKAAHVAAAGVSFLTGTFPAVSMEATMGFVTFLIPVMFSSIVYKFSKSIFLTSIMFMVIYWEPFHLSGMLMLSKILTSYFTAHVGIIVILTSFMIFISYFEKGNKLKLFAYFVLSIFALAVAYNGYVLLPILIGIVGFLIYHVKDNKKLAVVFAILIVVFISMPLWSFTAHELVGLEQRIPYVHIRYTSAIHAFNPSEEIFPLWVSSAFGVISASFLIINNRYRAFSIIVLLVSLVHLLSISEEISLYYTFYYKALRSIGLMFSLSIAMNLIMFHFIIKQFSFNPTKFFSKLFKHNFSKIAVLGILLLILFPGFRILEDRTQDLYDRSFYRQHGAYIETFPGGNERNLQFWLYENAKPNDLILNDLTHATGWFMGFRGQELVNGPRQAEIISRFFHFGDKTFETIPGAFTTLRANEILKHPWDHTKIEEIINELDIKYIYLSEREMSPKYCGKWSSDRECYPNSQNWPWKEYSKDARIAMYENHPSLELVLRNGDSAIFRVI